MKVLGREPALIIGAINAVIMFGGTLGFSLLGMEQAALWVTAVNAISAVILSLATRPWSASVFSYALASVIALGAGYGIELKPEAVNGLNGLIVPILMLITRGQVSPIETRVTKSSLDPTIEAARAEGKATDTAGPVETTA